MLLASFCCQQLLNKVSVLQERYCRRYAGCTAVPWGVLQSVYSWGASGLPESGHLGLWIGSSENRCRWPPWAFAGTGVGGLSSQELAHQHAYPLLLLLLLLQASR